MLLAGLKAVDDVRTGVKHVIGDIIAKDTTTRQELKTRYQTTA